MPENDVKLTKLAKCAGCGAKVGAGVLAQLLDGIQVHRDPNLDRKRDVEGKSAFVVRQERRCLGL